MQLNSFIALGVSLLLGHTDIPDIRMQTCNEFLQAIDKKDTLSYNEIDLEAQCVDTLKRYTDFKKPLYTQSQNTLKKYPI